jgi:hypothetical protein
MWPCPLHNGLRWGHCTEFETNGIIRRHEVHDQAKETYMTQHSESQSGFLHNFKRMFAPAPPATVASAPGADAWQPLIQEA